MSSFARVCALISALVLPQALTAQTFDTGQCSYQFLPPGELKAFCEGYRTGDGARCGTYMGMGSSLREGQACREGVAAHAKEQQARHNAAGSQAPKRPASAATRPVAPDGTRMATASPSTTTASSPPQFCRQTLLDQLGKVGVKQVRAMTDLRFKEAAIEGKVPNSNNLRLDLRGSACDDPRIKATLYDFDANGTLQSITYLWGRPSGPAPAPIFAERAQTLSRLFGVPAPQSPERLQADTSLGRLILQDMPERNLLLEAYAAPR
jgi:hypothetical protein